MSTLNDIYLSALKFICGDSKHVCRICFASTEQEEVNLTDCFDERREEDITFSDILKYLGMYEYGLLPQTLCKSCARSLINTYKFHKLHKFSIAKWKDIVHLLETSMSSCNSLNRQVQGVYLMINNSENRMFTSNKYSSNGKTKALLNLKDILRRHSVIKNQSETHGLLCNICGKKFDGILSMKKHLKTHTQTSYPCPICPKIFASKFLLNEHSKRVHHPKRLKCTQCNEKFSTTKLLSLHIKFNHVVVSCKYCNLQLESGRLLRAHQQKHFKYECQFCKRTFKNNYSCNLHAQTCEKNNNRTKFICDICNKVYARKSALRIHMVIDHNFGPVLSCQWCKKKFESISRLNEHIVTHTKVKNYQCEQCGGKFVTKPALRYHTRLHTGETPYPCDLCDMSFISASRRSEHKQSKHFEPTKACPHCDRKFSRGHQLKIHVAKHSNPHSKLYVGLEGNK